MPPNDPADSADPGKTSSSTASAPKSGPGWPALITAAILLALYVGLTIAMIAHFATDTTKETGQMVWERTLLIYNSFMSFAAAAGGVLLGTQIQQAQVGAAHQQAAAATQEADKAKQAAVGALAATHADPAASASPPMAAVRAELLKAF